MRCYVPVKTGYETSSRHSQVSISDSLGPELNKNKNLNSSQSSSEQASVLLASTEQGSGSGREDQWDVYIKKLSILTRIHIFTSYFICFCMYYDSL